MMINKKILSVFLLLICLSSLIRVPTVRAATEDLTTWVETDAGLVLTVTSSRATWTAMGSSTSNNHVSKDYGALFIGNFKINADFCITSQTSGATRHQVNIITVGAITNNDYTAQTFVEALAVYPSASSTTDFKMAVNTKKSAAETSVLGSYTYTVGTVYYASFERSGLPSAIGYPTITAKIYSDSGRTTLLETITTNAGSLIDHQYVQVASSPDIVTNIAGSGYAENVEIISMGARQGIEAVSGLSGASAIKMQSAGRLVFYAEGLLWALTNKGSTRGTAYSTSSDSGATWVDSGTVVVPDGTYISTYEDWEFFSVAQYGSKLGLVHSGETYGVNLEFRQYTLYSNGTMSLDDDAQIIAIATSPGNSYCMHPHLIYDSTGHPIVVYSYAAGTGTTHLRALKNQYTNGTWLNDDVVTDDSIFSTGTTTHGFPQITELDNGKLFVFYTAQILGAWYTVHDTSSWSDIVPFYVVGDEHASLSIAISQVDVNSIKNKAVAIFFDNTSDIRYGFIYDDDLMSYSLTELQTLASYEGYELVRNANENSIRAISRNVNGYGFDCFVYDGNSWSLTKIPQYDSITTVIISGIRDVMPDCSFSGNYTVYGVDSDSIPRVFVICFGDDTGRPIITNYEITNFDDTNNLYARYKNYTIEMNVYDEEDDVEIIQVRLAQVANQRAEFTYNATANTFFETSGLGLYKLYTTECIANTTGDNYNLTFAFTPYWNATEESNLDLTYEISDSKWVASTGTYRFDYADCVTSLAVTSIEYSDADSPDRININSTVVINSNIYYRSNPGANTVVSGETRVFGNTNVGNLVVFANNTAIGNLWSGSLGTAQNIKAYLKPSGAGSKYIACLYTQAGVLVDQTAEYTSVGATALWVTFTFAVPPSLTSQNYYIMIVGDTDLQIGCFAGQGTRGYFVETYDSSFPATATFIQDTQYKYSLYCTYVTPSVTIPTAGTKFPDQTAFTLISLYDQYNNVVATDTTIVSSGFTFTFNADVSSLLTTYNLFVNMVAPEYVDAEFTNPTETLITDQIIVDFVGASDTDVTAQTNSTIFCTAYYEYDHVYLSVGDSVWLDGYQLTYDISLGVLVGYPLVNTFVTTVTFDTVTDVDDHLYSLTVGTVSQVIPISITWNEYSGTPTYTTTTSSCITTTYCETSVTYIVTISLTSTCSTSVGNTTIAGPITTTNSTATVITTSFSLSTILTTRVTTSGPVSTLTTGITSVFTTLTSTIRRTVTFTTDVQRTAVWTVTNYLGQTYTYSRIYSTFITCSSYFSTHPTSVTRLWSSYVYTTLDEETKTKVPTVSTVTTTTLSTTFSTSFVTTTSNATVTTTSPSTMTTTSANGTSTATIDATQVITIKTYYFFRDTVTSIDATTTTCTTTTSTNSTSTETSVTTTETQTTSVTTSKSTSVTCETTETCSTLTTKTSTTTCTSTCSTRQTCTTTCTTSKTTTVTCTTSISTSRTCTSICETEVETVTDTSTLIDTCTTTCETETSVETEITTTCTTIIETNSTCVTTCETITEGETTCLTTTITEETCETETSTETTITCETVCETSEIANTTCTTVIETEESTTCTTTCSTLETCTTTCSTYVNATTSCTTTCDTLEFVDETSTTTCSTLIETEETTTSTSTCTTTTGIDTITVQVTTTTCTTLTNSLGSTSTSTITTISKTTTTTTAAGGGGAGGDTNILILPITIGAILTVLFVALGKKRR